MMYVFLNGGLGNQLFITCFAHGLATKRGADLTVITKEYRKKTGRSSYLDTLLEHFYDHQLVTLPKDLHGYISIFDDTPIPSHSDLILRGYFQNWSLIQPYVQQFKAMMALHTRYPVHNFSEKSLHTTIALHFRRGDYLVPPFDKIYELLPESYYHNALTHLLGQSNQWTQIMIFCEEKDWSQHIEPIVTNLKIQFWFPIVRSGQTNALDDFCTMSHCGAIVTANSSFSYWAALLSNASHIVRPTIWFQPEFQKNPPPHIVPEDASVICPPHWTPISPSQTTFVSKPVAPLSKMSELVLYTPPFSLTILC